MSELQADKVFLRRILFGLVVATLCVGSVAGYASVSASQSGGFSLTLNQNWR